MIKKVAIRYARHQDKEQVGRTVHMMNPGTKKADEIKQELNAFFASENLPYYAAISEEGRIGG